jgi:hypothetical protein
VAEEIWDASHHLWYEEFERSADVHARALPGHGHRPGANDDRDSGAPQSEREARV